MLNGDGHRADGFRGCSQGYRNSPPVLSQHMRICRVCCWIFKKIAADMHSSTCENPADYSFHGFEVWFREMGQPSAGCLGHELIFFQVVDPNGGSISTDIGLDLVQKN